MAVITLSRQVGSGLDEIVGLLRGELGYGYFDKHLLVQEALKAGMTEDEIVDFSETAYKTKSLLENLFSPGMRVVTSVPISRQDETGIERRFVKHLDESDCIRMIRRVIRIARTQGNMIIVGRGGQVVLQDLPDVLHVRLVAPMHVRARRIMHEEGWTELGAREYAEGRDRAAAEYMQRFFHVNWDDPTLYHLTINTGMVEPQEAAQIIVEAVRRREAVPVA